MRLSGSREPGRSVLPSFTTAAIALVAAWVSVAGYVWTEAGQVDRALTGPLPGAVALGFALGDYVLWRSRGRPWHDWPVILLLLPAIAAGVWTAIGALVLEAAFSREELLGIAVGPGIALVGLLTTTISYHGRHHPDEFRAPS
jgi:hypothetical protein